MKMCTHPDTLVRASIGYERPGLDDLADRDDAFEEGLRLLPLDNDVTEFNDLRFALTVGKCGRCGTTVATVRMWDETNWTPVRGPAWSTGWIPLVQDSTDEEPTT